MADSRGRLSAESADLLRKLSGPGWDELTAAVKAEMEHHFAMTARSLMAGEPIVPERIAYERGFYACAKFILDRPVASKRLVERLLREHNTEGVESA